MGNLEIHEVIENITQGHQDIAQSAGQRAAQAVDFFFAQSPDDAVTPLLVCLEKEAEFLEREAAYVEEHLPYYNPTVPISRQQEAVLLKEVIQGIAALK